MTRPRIGALFTGYGGLEMGVQAALGGTVEWVSDIDPGACKILAHRYPGIPNHGDITSIDWAGVEPVDILTGGFPCQDVSHAGLRKGMHPDTRSGLWTHMAYAINQLRPRLVVAENVRGLLSAKASSDVEPCPWCLGDGEDVAPLRALGAVLGDLAELGYDCRVRGLRAADVGAPHGRFRVFVVATDAGCVPTGGKSAPRQGDDRWAHAASAGRRGTRSAADTELLRRERDRTLGRRRDEPANSGSRTTPDTTGDGRDERWPEPTRLERGPDAALSGAAIADASSERHGRGENRRSVGRMARDHESETRQRERPRSEPEHRSVEAAADADSIRLHRLPELDPSTSTRIDSEHRGHPDRRSHSTDWGPYTSAIRRWEHTLRRQAPAPTEPGRNGNPRLAPKFVEFLMGLPAGWVCDVPGLTRNEQLKALGNGVVPQQAETAIRILLNANEAAA